MKKIFLISLSALIGLFGQSSWAFVCPQEIKLVAVDDPYCAKMGRQGCKIVFPPLSGWELDSSSTCMCYGQQPDSYKFTEAAWGPLLSGAIPAGQCSYVNQYRNYRTLVSTNYTYDPSSENWKNSSSSYFFKECSSNNPNDCPFKPGLHEKETSPE